MSRLETALQQSIVGFFKDRGIEPARISGNNYYYFSPFKPENNPSLCVNVSKYGNEMFKDFSSGDKLGDIINLVRRLHSVNTSEAISIVLDGEVRDINQHKPKPTNKPSIIVGEGKLLESNWLTEYICGARGVDVEVAKKYCEQVMVEFPLSKKSTKPHKCIGFKNKKGGYELRNPYLKVSSSPKMYTWVEGKNSNIIDVWEGFIDFLSYLSDQKTLIPKHDSIILNGLCNIPYIQFMSDKQYHIYIDNDYPATKELNKLDIDYVDKRNTFETYKDYNEAFKDNFRRTKEINRARDRLRGLLSN